MITHEVSAETSPYNEVAAEVVEQAENQLRRNAYVTLKNISCTYCEGVLTLTGCVPTYYLKQVAQTVVGCLNNVDRVENRIEVVSPGRMSAYSV